MFFLNSVTLDGDVWLYSTVGTGVWSPFSVVLCHTLLVTRSYQRYSADLLHG